MRKETSNYNYTPDNIAYRNNRKLKREDKSYLKCTYNGCGKIGHTEDNCWTKDLSKIPRSIKDKFNTNTANRHIEVVSANTETNLATFRDAYSSADELGMPSILIFLPNLADTSPQMCSVPAGRRLRKVGGVGTDTLKYEEAAFTSDTMGAFLAGTSCTSDTWLADTGVNMHIVNDMKWFKKGTFRLFKDCSINISTADGSTTLEVRGGGTV